ncbi:MAG: sensor domain-containing protein [Gammaproteobacteria bacterium]
MTPTTIDQYLEQLRSAMRNDDPALTQDALYDAEEYLRAELAQHPGQPASEVLRTIVASYGAPEEVAAAYRETENQVAQALRTPTRTPSGSALGRLFGVFVDPKTYAAMFYMLLALATGILYFTVVITGLSVSIGLAITLIGIPFFLLFLALVRVLSLVEGRVVEVMLDVRMPRRPVYRDTEQGLWARIGGMFTDERTWTTMLYMVLQLPLGIAYFVLVVAGLSVSLSLVAAPLAVLFGASLWLGNGAMPVYLFPFVSLAGVALLLLTLHACRGIAGFHGALAKYLLVRN